MIDEKKERLGAHEVAVWLRRHPRFLGQFPDLALSLVIPREDGPAASLTSYQLEVLREKNRELNRRLAELYSNALENERLTVCVHQLGLSLMSAGSAADTVRAMAASLSEDFAGELVRIISFRPIENLHADWLQVIAQDDARLAPFRDCLASDEPICGRLNPDKMAVLFANAQGKAQSVALLPLPGVGLVAVASSDGNRFFPGMGTLFLRLMGESYCAALARFSRD